MSVELEATVLDSLRPVFPKIEDRVLSTCIRKVQERVRSDRRPATHELTIIQECANMLLDANKEVNDSLTTPLPEHLDVVDSPLKDHDDVVSVLSNTNRTSKVIGISTNAPFLNIVTPSPLARKTVKKQRRILFKTPTSNSTVRNFQDLTQEIPGVDVPTVHVEPVLDLIKSTSTTPTKSGLKRATEIEPSNVLAQCRQLEKKDNGTKSPGEAQKEKDCMENFSSIVSGKYSKQCYRLLLNEFRIIPVKYIKIAFSKYNGHDASTRRYLQEQLRISSATATSTTTSATQNTSALPSTVDTTNTTDELGFDKPPKILLLKRKRPFVPEQRGRKVAKPAKKALGDILYQKQPGCKTQVPNQNMQTKEMAHPVVKEGTPDDDVLEGLSNCIGKDWMKLGRRLQVSQAKLDEIDHSRPDFNEKAYHMLLFWKQQNGSHATYSILSVALCHDFVNRRDLAEKNCFYRESRAETNESHQRKFFMKAPARLKQQKNLRTR
ncbi:uncharacterized protein LOC144641389 isoform X2 [Oculina patagonica]